ncbi:MULTISPECIES: GNAT family N-acetyltransferase [Pseudomonas]|uniref:GNAT family N-acetyltransferase n=1 Tax=Pseudomonas sessilinigenes TaxID=658629 RepID=A0ABX8MVG9_9PSED|nr:MULTISPECIES: GNAT family N-acetyltransferase [Pseudomonas]AZC22483.1 acetyltransferase, GNAT family [Pseudomonas sessilinigenes]QIH06080.1 GNAT family N-acetyltransferase [Pseudomonas sp. BIOMIG1BAC]QXH41545.1 GNAT family N-acetyltransferase [Pseudomonas sessilinigenes]
MQCQVRKAEAADATRISQVILAALLTSNAQDYPASVIERVKASFTADGVLHLMQSRRMFVALVDGALLGTASLDGRAVRTMFVDPAWQGRGIGRCLMLALQQAARESGEQSLIVPASITAEGFYARLGFRTVREQLDGEERTLIMERPL